MGPAWTRLSKRHLWFATPGRLGIKTHGTIGILVRTIRREQRSKEQILAVLQSLPARSTLHLKRSLLVSVLGQVERNV